MAKANPALNPSKNRLLAQLPREQFEHLSSRMQRVDLPVNLPIYEPNVPIEYAYFPDQGMISVVSVMQDGDSIEIGTIGREGMAGAFILQETDSLPYRFFVQVPGHGQRIVAALIKETAERSPELRKVISRYQAAFLTQTMQGVACIGLHAVQQRCCRWLLMARDRADSDDLKLTHEFLGLMLGVRRASVTDVLRPLQNDGLVRSNHGTITILDRKGLEAGACECYRLIADQQRKLVPSEQVYE
jgi:CRP-like cAMP-binding protein